MYRMLTALVCLQFLTAGPIGNDLAQADESARPTEAVIDFGHEIAPILTGRCVRCHGRGQAKGGFRIDTRDTVLAGGDSGPAVVAGKPDESLLIELISGKNPDRIMPQQGARLSEAEIDHVRRWIAAGLPWPDGISFARPSVDQNLDLREVKLPEAPPGSEWRNPIDRILREYFGKHPPAMAGAVDDRAYARRVYLEVIGLIPTASELESFLADTSPDKRERLVKRLLTDNRRYAEHWLSFWNDVLRNDYQGTGYIDGGRKQITDWLYRALADNMPYDQFVRELVNPGPQSEGFAKGIVWRGVVNASQVPAMQTAQNIGQILLGTNLKCASCHDSFVNAWKLSDAYALAAIYADGPLEMHKCDKPLGEIAKPGFLFPAIGTIDPSASKAERLAQLAEVITSRRNGRLPRTIVNRLWDRFFGRGLIEPVDAMENAPWNADLLEWLAADLVENDYDLKHTIALMLTSRAYQMPAVGAKALDDDFVFAGPLVRRMSAEQFIDSVSQITGVWQSGLATATALREVVADSSGEVASGPVRFSSGLIDHGSVAIDIDVSGAHTLWLVAANGKQGPDSDWASWCEPELTVADKTIRLTDLEWKIATSGYQKPQINKNVVGGTLGVDGREAAFGIGTHGFSAITYDLPPGTTRFRAAAGPDNGAMKSVSGHEMEFLVLTDVAVRAAMVPADSLMKALGRPNREQVVTRRSTTATTLEALELNNGPVLDGMLKEGSRRWLAKKPWSTPELVEAIYRTALGRQPTIMESELACDLIGPKPDVPGVADLLWALSMLPEFQLIQ